MFNGQVGEKLLKKKLRKQPKKWEETQDHGFTVTFSGTEWSLIECCKEDTLGKDSKVSAGLATWRSLLGVDDILDYLLD